MPGVLMVENTAEYGTVFGFCLFLLVFGFLATSKVNVHDYGVISRPVICLIMAISNSAIIDCFQPIHCIWTYYCVVRYKKLGHTLKLVTCTCLLPLMLILWPVVGIVGNFIGGAAYGFLSPIFATSKAVDEGKENKLFHCFIVSSLFRLLKSL
ncbi:hypothetical protein VNO78_12242 [Psophocarpus tetragonolobus]|uniref:Uncharacterized protein n=1 Tax=Psophocarpus tetragonolobus TaxID=3891 RepID=A0AAN9SVH9_PSOTE